MSAETLREAAERLRWLAGQVRRHGDGWFDADVDLRKAIRDAFKGNQESAPDDARWIATMHPGVGLALAPVLDALAKRVEDISDATPSAKFGERVAMESLSGYAEAVDLARLILGGAS